MSVHDYIASKITAGVPRTKVQTYSIHIPDEVVDAYASTECSFITVGIHTIFILPYLVTEARCQMEFTALCVLQDISYKHVQRLYHITGDVGTAKLYTIVSITSYRKYVAWQCGVMALYAPSPLPRLRITNPTFGTITYPMLQDKEQLALQTKFCSDIFKSYCFRILPSVYHVPIIDPQQLLHVDTPFFIQPLS
jgi:hypothetical protein